MDLNHMSSSLFSNGMQLEVLRDGSALEGPKKFWKDAHPTPTLMSQLSSSQFLSHLFLKIFGVYQAQLRSSQA
jgi:hypothetical protein